MRILIVCLAAALASATLPAAPCAAQPVEQAGASSPRRMALARQYLNLLMTDQFEGVVREMLGAEFDNDSEMQALPDEDRRFILGLTAELTTDLVPQMISQMVPIYAATFTEGSWTPWSSSMIRLWGARSRTSRSRSCLRPTGPS